MNRNPYRVKKSRKIVEACLFLVLALSFVVSNLFMTKWLPSFDNFERSLSWHDGLYRGGIRGENNDDGEILHVVTSRFMQGQPTLRALAKARLKLFETFCLPTMLHQDAKNFLWFVMIDPQLDTELLDHLESLLEPIPNFYLVASNAKLLTPSNITTMLSSTEHKESATSSTTHQKLLLTGDVELLKHRMLDPHRPLLLETRLDADDGLNRQTLSEIQTIAKALPVDTKGWQIVCSNLHYEWRNVDILAIDSNATTSAESSISSGKLRIVKETICVTPGYTLVRHRETPSTDFPPWPKLGHNLVNREWPECRVDNDTIVGISVETNDGNATHDCWKKMGLFPSALRSRTVTSAGMSRIETSEADAAKFESRTEQFWKLVKRDFDIVPEDARSTSQYIREHLGGIASDNLEGQCSPGHSCKNSSKAKLEEILAKTSRSKPSKIS